MGWQARSDYWLYVCEGPGEGIVTRETAERYATHGSRWKDDTKQFVSNPNWHTPSWVSTEEFAVVAKEFPDEPEYRAILAAMIEFENQSLPSRLVFWFDN